MIIEAIGIAMYLNLTPPIIPTHEYIEIHVTNKADCSQAVDRLSAALSLINYPNNILIACDATSELTGE